MMEVRKERVDLNLTSFHSKKTNGLIYFLGSKMMRNKRFYVIAWSRAKW